MKIGTKDGYKFCQVNDINEFLTFYHEEKQREIFFYPYLREGMRFVDIGCNVGSYSIPALAKGCKVTSINPLTPSLYVYNQNLILNRFNPTIIEKALYSKKGYINPMTQDFRESPPNYSNSGKLEYRNEDDYYYECDTLDNLFNGGVDYIKIDVEGAELEVLKGAEKTIKKNKPVMLVENHLFKNQSIEILIHDLIINKWGLKYQYETRHYELPNVVRRYPVIGNGSDLGPNHSHSLFF